MHSCRQFGRFYSLGRGLRWRAAHWHFHPSRRVNTRVCPGGQCPEAVRVLGAFRGHPGLAFALLKGDGACIGGRVTRSIRVLVLLGVAVAGSIIWPAEALAQRYGVRVGVGFGGYFYPHPFYAPFYFSPFYFSAFYSPWYGYGPYGGPYPPYYGHYYYDDSAARIQAKPRETQVYADGYFVGTVDDFDGIWQRLHLAPGQHELTLYLEGHRTFTQKVLFRPHTTLRIAHTMQPLAPGEANEPRPTASAPPPQRGPVPSRGRDRGYGPPERRGGEAEDFGALSLRVQPEDAVVTIDGERWDSPGGGSRLQVQLSEGSHRVEVTRAGHKPYSTTVEVRRGETVTLNVSLPREQ
jgi:hypothetical protein